MKALDEQDLALLEAAREVIRRNYDGDTFNCTVGAALLCGDGSVFVGVNLYSVHSVCAEHAAIGAAFAAGNHDLRRIVAVRGREGEEVLPPCGNCRQILFDRARACEVIVPAGKALVRVSVEELLPFAYEEPELSEK